MQLKGGIGNQLFQYSLGRQLSIKNQTELKLDISFYDDETLEDFLLPHSKFLIKDFDTRYTLCSESEKAKLVNKSRLFLSRVKRKINPYNTNLFIEKSLKFDPAVLSLPKDVFLTGWFQSEKYFFQIKELLKKELLFKKLQGNAHKQMAQKITSLNSVSIHVRRGDYFKNAEHTKYFGILNLNYYKKCVEYINNRVSNPHYFIFSDDVSWVVENFKIAGNKTIVDLKNESSAVGDMHLMSLCKHNVIANSSYSWWAAWLNNNVNKIVMAPSPWFGTDTERVNDMVPNDWIKMCFLEL